jgi:hypothetical protein
MAGGRPPIFGPQICADIIKSVKDLLPLKICAEENGIHYETLRAWINEGIDDLLAGNVTEKAKFSVAMKKEVANSMRNLLKIIGKGKNGWQGSAWILERRWWKYWSSKVADMEFDERLTELENKQNPKVYNGAKDGKINDGQKKENTKK